MINLQTTKSYLSRDEMRMINGGLLDEGYCSDMKKCNWDSGCPSACPKCLATSGPDTAGICGTAD